MKKKLTSTVKASCGLTINQAHKYGYRVVSSKYRRAARVDIENWQEVNSCSDMYRRVYSRDVIDIPASWVGKLPNSNDSTVGYKRKPNELAAMESDYDN